MKEIKKTYTNGEVTVIWQPHLCQHSANCFSGLPRVFNPDVRPWVDPMAADSDAIIAQIKKCPSGALTFILNENDASGAQSGNSPQQ